MLAAEDIADMLHCPSGGSSSQEADCALLGSTPGTWDSATRLKRQRLLDSTSPSCGSGHSSQQQWQPQNKAAQPAAAAPAATAPPTPSSVAISGVPWQASYLFDYVQRCLEGLTALHPVCQHIQAHTRAAEMACAVFRHAYVRRSPAAQAALAHERLLVQALLAASLWLALKFEANRTTTPDSNLMSRLTGGAGTGQGRGVPVGKLVVCCCVVRSGRGLQGKGTRGGGTPPRPTTGCKCLGGLPAADLM